MSQGLTDKERSRIVSAGRVLNEDEQSPFSVMQVLAANDDRRSFMVVVNSVLNGESVFLSFASDDTEPDLGSGDEWLPLGPGDVFSESGFTGSVWIAAVPYDGVQYVEFG